MQSFRWDQEITFHDCWAGKAWAMQWAVSWHLLLQILTWKGEPGRAQRRRAEKRTAVARWAANGINEELTHTYVRSRSGLLMWLIWPTWRSVCGVVSLWLPLRTPATPPYMPCCQLGREGPHLGHSKFKDALSLSKLYWILDIFNTILWPSLLFNHVQLLQPSGL